MSKAGGNMLIDAEYKNRTSFQNNHSRFILKEIAVADEGTFECHVDYPTQPVESTVIVKLNVFSPRPDTLPVISPCTKVDEPSSCSIHVNQSVTLTCTLPNVYPVKDTELVWYRDGKRVSSTHNATQNDDGTTDISRQIQVSETGNFTCNATYFSAKGRDDTAVSVEAWNKPPSDVRNTTGKNVTGSQIDGMTIRMMLFVAIAGISLAIITRFFYRSKATGKSGLLMKYADKYSKFYRV
ncbi:T-lymphocyte activation antigen CD80-like [Strongylocentrotus purpuratus]|uniref:Ig-like domain-containing protein n=1 Tax=Strongylocentrotus purpuratus TaxID=7668 RepID=A0A7M7HPK9_STRPU|nr:T-lymphocyte activation antigen CD80-like [Strongylocentrotus purpuratus]|eukprot:XP_011684152.1 PREDICTED: T-lymphocyte activation antigen CD80-like [Strongylocentrotus purpuratus]